MCGIFGYVTKDNRPVDIEILREVATVTARRGRDAWGMAWIDGQGRMCQYKQCGPVVDSLGILAMARDARYLIGHCRLATHGDPTDNENNHPHPVSGGWFVHNGVIRSHADVTRKFRLKRRTACDSEVLGLLIQSMRGSLQNRAWRATDVADGAPLVFMGLWKPGRIVLIRRGNPMHTGTTHNAMYFGSLAAGLPGDVSQIVDNTISIYGE